MRGIVLENKKRSTIVLTNDNQYIKVKTGKHVYEIGEEIQIPAPARRAAWLQIPYMKLVLSGVALCVMLVSIFPMFRTQPHTLPVEAYVSIDINPSLEVGVDSNLHVGSIRSFNEDGSKVISQLSNWKGEPLQDVVDSILHFSDKDGFLRGDRHVVISTNAIDPSSAFANMVRDKVQQIVKNEEDKQHVTITTMKGSTSIRNTSDSLGVSEGKYMLYEDAKQRGIHVSLQHVKETSISDLDQEWSQAASEETKQELNSIKKADNNQNQLEKMTHGENEPSDSKSKIQQSDGNDEKKHSEGSHKENNAEIHAIDHTPSQETDHSMNKKSYDDSSTEKHQTIKQNDGENEEHDNNSR